MSSTTPRPRPTISWQFIKGPDFPTGGVILGTGGFKEAYRTGRGRVRVRAKAHTE